MIDEDKIKLQELSYKWLNGTLTDAEQLEFDSWFVQTNTAPLEVPADVAENKAQYRQLIFRRIKEEITGVKERRPYKLWPRISVAAAVIGIAIGIYFYSNSNSEARKQAQYDLAYNHIAPGSAGATLTLTNGKKIKLNDAASGEIAKEAGIAITKTADGQLVYELKGNSSDPNQINTLSTAKGETYILSLPDKSKVWLNAASKLTYTPTLTERGVRMVTLEGEAYFEIAKDKAHPFVVKTDKQQVEVLGTHFNVNAYSDEPIVATTLLEGSVRVTGGSQNKMLKPGQQALNNGTILQVSQANVEEATAWKDGNFQFSDEKLSDIVRKLERWYNVEIDLSDKFAGKEFSGNISRTRNISRVLRMMEKTNDIHFKIEGRRITAIEK